MSNQAEGAEVLFVEVVVFCTKRDIQIPCKSILLIAFYFSNDETAKSSKVSQLTLSWGVVTDLGEITLLFVMSQIYSTGFLKVEQTKEQDHKLFSFLGCLLTG